MQEENINWLEKITHTANYISRRVAKLPDTAIILGTGLGELVDHIKIESDIRYQEIPNFPVSTVEGHKGRLIFGYLGDKYIMAMQGRFHYYEGYSMKEVTFPVRVMHALGVKTLLVSNAAGGPLRGHNYSELGPRFPAMGEAYSRHLIGQARAIAQAHGITLREGVYVGVQGPTFETPAEYRFFHVIGGDAVGMSTVPEVIVARHMDMQVFGISVITDLGGGAEIVEASHEDVQKAAAAAEPHMTLIMKELIARL